MCASGVANATEHRPAEELKTEFGDAVVLCRCALVGYLAERALRRDGDSERCVRLRATSR